MKETNERGSMSGVFVFVLLGLFALLSTLMVLLGAQAYRSTTERTQENSQARLLTAFVRNALMTADRVEVSQVDGITLLTLPEGQDEEGETYVKRLYCYDGELMEQMVAFGEVFEPENGEAICEAQGMTARQEGTLLVVTLTDPEGTSREVRFSLRVEQDRGEVS